MLKPAPSNRRWLPHVLTVLGLLSCHRSESGAAQGAAGDSGDTKATAGGRPATSGTAAPAKSGSPGETNLVLPAASASAFQNPASLPAYSGPTGSVEGTIFVTGDAAPDVTTVDFSRCPTAKDEYGKLFREGAPNAEGARPLADAFVAVTGYSGFYLPSTSQVRKTTIENCGFAEHTIDMTIGERLDVYNHTKGLYAPGFAQVQTPAIMIATPMGDPVRLYPTKPAYYTLLEKTGAAPFMVSNVYVVAYPLHTVSGRDGHYRIDGVPVGKLEVNARLAAIQRTASKPVEVVENVVAHVDLVLNYQKPAANVAPRPGPDAGRKQHD